MRELFFITRTIGLTIYFPLPPLSVVLSLSSPLSPPLVPCRLFPMSTLPHRRQECSIAILILVRDSHTMLLFSFLLSRAHETHHRSHLLPTNPLDRQFATNDRW